MRPLRVVPICGLMLLLVLWLVAPQDPGVQEPTATGLRAAAAAVRDAADVELAIARRVREPQWAGRLTVALKDLDYTVPRLAAALDSGGTPALDDVEDFKRCCWHLRQTSEAATGLALALTPPVRDLERIALHLQGAVALPPR